MSSFYLRPTRVYIDISMGDTKGYLLWVALAMIILFGLCARGDGELQVGFYSNSCPNLQNIVSDGMQDAMEGDKRMAASILRMFFHDCAVQGCDASIMLDDTASFKGEKSADPNRNSVRGFEVIDAIKASVEDACPALVSCADILALAARDAVALSGGPGWDVPLGRRDARTASFDAANSVLPSPFSDVNDLISSFQALGFTLQDMVTLSGAHTVGQARCLFFRQRLYNMTGDGKPDSTLNTYYLRVLQDECPESGGGDDNLVMLDPYSPAVFDNRYYLNLMYGRGLFTSDQTLYSSAGNPTVQLVRSYAQNPQLFFTNFISVMVKLSSLHPLTGSEGEIRRNCHFLN